MKQVFHIDLPRRRRVEPPALEQPFIEIHHEIGKSRGEEARITRERRAAG